MADDRMRNDDDQQRNMGSNKRDDQDLGQGQQTPGRNPQDRQEGGQRRNPSNMEDDEEFGGGTTGQRGGQDRGGQNR